MTPFWEGVLAGYGIAIPVGAIGILIIDLGLRRGFAASFLAGAGAATADFIYASLAAAAGTALAVALSPFAFPLKLGSGLLLIAIGGIGLRRMGRSRENGTDQDSQSRGLSRTYFEFLGLTLLNPLTVAYFAALILGGSAGSIITPADRVLFVLGAALSSLSWQSLLAAAGALARQHFTPRIQTGTRITGNLIVILLGLRMLLQ